MNKQQSPIGVDFLDAYTALNQAVNQGGNVNITIEQNGQTRQISASPQLLQGMTMGVAGAAFSGEGADLTTFGRVSEDKLGDFGLTREDVRGIQSHPGPAGAGGLWFSGVDLIPVLAKRYEHETRAGG